MRRCVNDVMRVALELQQLRRPTREAVAALSREAVAKMAEACTLLIEQQHEAEAEHYTLVHAAVARKRRASTLDEHASELVRPGSAVKRQAVAGAGPAKSKRPA